MFISTERRNLRAVLGLAAAAISAAFLAGPAEAQAQAPAQGLMQPGYAAVTGFSGTLTQPAPQGQDPASYITIDTDGISAAIVDLTGLGPQGQLGNAPKTFTVKASDVGQVFGIALDDDRNPNLFLAATSAYGIAIGVPDASGYVQRVRNGAPDAVLVPGQFGQPAYGGGPGSIWRVDGTTGEIALFANIDTGVSALGGLAFDPASQQIFVADRATGIIHRLAMNGAEQGTYDHGVEGRPAAGLAAFPQPPTAPVDVTNPGFDSTNPGTWGLAPAARRIFGVAVHDGRLYYGVAQGPQVWSTSIASTGAIPGNDARLEAEVPALQDGMEIASITFDGNGNMYLAERGATTGDFNLANLANGGAARVLRLVPKPPGQPGPGNWRLQPDQYAIGLPPQYNNANGGVALGYGYDQTGAVNYGACGATVVSTGERLLDPGSPAAPAGSFPYVDGLQINSTSLVEPQNTPPTAAWFADFNDIPGDASYRGFMGAVATQPCPGIYVPPVVCPPGTSYTNGQCVVIVTCPPGTIYRDGICTYPSCPSGYYRDNRGQCVPPPQACPRDSYFYNGRCVPFCPPGLTRTPSGYCACPPGLNYRDGRCVPPNNCPPGMFSQGGACVCPVNSHYDPRAQRCVPNCPPGNLFDPQYNRCVPFCPPGFPRLPNGMCAPPPICPPGQTIFHGHCVPNCPPGIMRLPNGQCLPPPIGPCPPGMERFHGQCVPVCPPLQKRDAQGVCRPSIIIDCAPGFILKGGKCVPFCPPGQTMGPNGKCRPGILLPPGGGVIQLPPGGNPPPCPPGQDRGKDGQCHPIIKLPPGGGVIQLPPGGGNPPPCPPGQVRGPNGQCSVPPIKLPPGGVKPLPGGVIQLPPGGGNPPPCPPGQVRGPNGQCSVPPIKLPPGGIKPLPGGVIQLPPGGGNPPPGPIKPIVPGKNFKSAPPDEEACGPNEIKLRNGKCVPKRN